MSEINKSVCFLLVLSYTGYMDQGRRLIRSLNKKFRDRHASSLPSSFGAIECHFARKKLLFKPEKN